MLIAVACCAALPVAAQLATPLPLDRGRTPRRELGIAPAQRIVILSGVLESGLDGSRYDALHALGAGGGVSLLRLPPGTRVLERDRARHRYVVELPQGDEGVRLDVDALAGRHWVTRHAARASLSGAIFVAAGSPAAPPAPSLGQPVTAGSAASDLLALALLGAAAPLLGLLLWLRTRPERRLCARAAKALRQLRREAARQGPVFAGVAEEARELWRVQGGRARAALRESSRLRLRMRHAEALHALGQIVRQLERARAQLIDHRVARFGTCDLETHLDELRGATSLALSADRQADDLADLATDLAGRT